MSATHNLPTVAELVSSLPARAAAFEHLGIDFCCGGKKRLDQACRDAGLDMVEVLLSLLQADSLSNLAPDARDWRLAPGAELCRHIVDTHHAYLRKELPRIAALARKVALVHGAGHPELVQLEGIFQAFRLELEAHMIEEEARLFPLCCERTEESLSALHASIAARESEHAQAGQALALMRALTNQYMPPPEACGSYRALFAALKDLERDMHIHVHLENNILFPRAAAPRPTTAAPVPGD